MDKNYKYKITLSYYDLELKEIQEIPLSLTEEGKDLLLTELFDELMENTVSIKVEV